MHQIITRLKNNQGAIKYITNTGWLFGEKIIRLTFGLLVSIWVARYLQPAQFGVFSYVQSFVGLFMYIATLGLDGIVVRELIKKPDNYNEILGTSFFLRLVGFGMLLIVLLLATSFTNNSSLENLFIFLFSFSAFFQSFNVIDFYFQSKVQSRFAVYASLTSLIVSSLLKVIFILLKFPLVAFLGVLIFESLILGASLSYQYYKQGLSLFNWTYNIRKAKELLSYSWPLILSGIVVAIYMKTDQIMIKFIMGDQAVGQYAAAVKLSEAWYFIPTVLCNSLFPAILNAKSTNTTLYRSRLKQLYGSLVWGGIIISVLTMAFGNWIIHVLYGIEFNETASVLKIHIWTGIFVGLGVAGSKWYIAENLQRYSFFRSACGAVINILLNLILIPQFGILGAAYATLAAQIVASYLFNVITKNTLDNFIMQTSAFVFPFSIYKNLKAK